VSLPESGAVYHSSAPDLWWDNVGEEALNEGENGVFPIQVSLQELLLFLCAVIFMALIKTQFLLMPKFFSGPEHVEAVNGSASPVCTTGN
jgi:hypothetical protein